MRLTVSLALQQYVLLQENRKLKDVNRQQQEKIKQYSQRVTSNSGILESILSKADLVGKEQYRQAERERVSGEFITDALVRLGFTTETKIVEALRQHLHLESVDLKELEIAPEVVKFLPRDLCEKSRMLPIKFQGNQLSLAMADPSDIYKIDNLAMMTGLKIYPVIARSSEIVGLLNRYYEDAQAGGEVEIETIGLPEPMEEIDIVIDDGESDLNIQELLNSSEVPPIIRIVNSILAEAIRYRASDIHIEPKLKYTVVRFRVDGMLQDKIRIPAELHAATVSRIKILAKLDISERRIPQDGRITVKSGTRMVDLRISTMPSMNGEKMVLRILDKSAAIKRLDDMGLLGDDLCQVRNLIRKPQGIVIATGPTGSGKTTMLYSILAEMLEKSRNFETIEEPVEYFLEEANQVAVFEKIGLSFATVLKATLRQDPDVILVGEVRDHDTADIAFKAALTGHMVLTTLHTNNSVASITRLIDMGIKPYLIASALEGVIAQRLVRRLCQYCKQEDSPDPAQLQLLKVSPQLLGERVYRPVGCPRCSHSGYLGRTGIYELFVMNDDYRHLITEDYREAKIFDMARNTGMKTLIEDGVEKVRLGQTTLDELLRVIGPQVRHERLCESCQQQIDAKFLFCPFCGKFKQNICTACQAPLEELWTVCPFCGQSRGSEIKSKLAGC
ncbi:MAG: ATPase, T2SS/T4P/T4SS family [Desulfuromonadaceae bacterium]